MRHHNSNLKDQKMMPKNFLLSITMKGLLFSFFSNSFITISGKLLKKSQNSLCYRTSCFLSLVKYVLLSESDKKEFVSNKSKVTTTLKIFLIFYIFDESLSHKCFISDNLQTFAHIKQFKFNRLRIF